MRLEEEPYGSCYAHRLQLRQYAEKCELHEDLDGLVVTVACAEGCEVQDFHSCRA
jgi:hypothetical protein